MVNRTFKIITLRIFIGLQLVGCSTAPSFTPLRPLQSEDSIIIATNQGVNIDKDVDGSEAIGKGMGKGAVGGAALGAQASFECGPLFFICLPATILAGGVIGTVIGGVGGAIEALPEKQQVALNEIINLTFNQTNIDKMLQIDFLKMTSNHWEITDNNATAIITIKVEKFGFSQYSGDELIMNLSASFSLKYSDLEKINTTKKYLFSYNSEKKHVNFWIEKDGENFKNELALGLESITQLMVDSLKSPPIRMGWPYFVAKK